MSNYIKISSIGPRAIEIDTSISLNKAVDLMINNLKNQISQVLPDKPDIIVLPEVCDRPSNFKMKHRKNYYDLRKDKILDYFISVAKSNNCYIAYSTVRGFKDKTYRNSTRLIYRDGKIVGTYNKNHIMVEETTLGGILSGRDANVIECDFGKVALAICFDLNFDELRMKYKKQKPDIILFSSVYHGGLMQNYWAYSLRSYFVGSIARLPCSIISPTGNVIASSTNYTNHVTDTINLDCELIHLDYNREKFQSIKEKYGEKVKISDPGYLGSVLISSETDEFNIKKIIKEYKLELLDDYLQRALIHRENNMED